MKIKKYILAGLLSCFAGVSVCSQHFQYLTFQKNNASHDEISVPLEGLKILFDAEQLQVTYPAGALSLPLVSLESMFFAESPTHIQSAGVWGAETLRFVSPTLMVNAPVGEPVRIYTVQGTLVGEQRVRTSGECIPVSSLPPGIYVVKVMNQTLKILKR